MIAPVQFIDPIRQQETVARARRAESRTTDWLCRFLTLSLVAGCALLARRVFFSETLFGGAPGLFTLYAATAGLAFNLAILRTLVARTSRVSRTDAKDPLP